MFLPDINVWLALTFESHIHHSAAKIWFDGLSTQPFHFCRMTQQGFLRLATNPKAFGDEAVSLTRAWELYDTIQRDSRCSLAIEPTTIEMHWRNFTQGEIFSPHVWNDAYLAAFALAANLEIVTFDKGFVKFKGVSCSILS